MSIDKVGIESTTWIEFAGIAESRRERHPITLSALKTSQISRNSLETGNRISQFPKFRLVHPVHIIIRPHMSVLPFSHESIGAIHKNGRLGDHYKGIHYRVSKTVISIKQYRKTRVNLLEKEIR